MAKLKVKQGGGFVELANFSQINSRLAALEGFRNSLSPVTVLPSPNTGIANYNAYTSHSFRLGNVVFLNVMTILSKATNFSSNGLRFFTLPANARPSSEKTIYRSCEAIQYNGELYGPNAFRTVHVNTDGSLTADMSGRDGIGCVRFNLQYVI